ncbi:MAG: hypothetical protein RLZZ293_137 [Pseudomonadota bacterium]|jgi:hypothetical protein
MFYVVERSVVVLKPKQPFLDWINDNLVTEQLGLLDLSSIRLDCNSYLIPEIEELEDGIAYVDEMYENFFRIELASWIDDQSLWPQELSLKMFWEWFDVEISPSLIDMTEADVEEEIGEETAETIH